MAGRTPGPQLLNEIGKLGNWEMEKGKWGMGTGEREEEGNTPQERAKTFKATEEKEAMSYRETEKQRHRDTDETEETDEVPPLAASVKTLLEAVQLSLKDGISENTFFLFSRAIKAFEVTHNRRLPPVELNSAFGLWWSTAKPLLPPDADFDEFRFDFEDTFAKTHAPLGSDSLKEAIRLADGGRLPPQADRYTSPKLKRLVAVCFHLQRLQGRSPFFLGLRAVQLITNAKSLYHAGAMMAGLIGDGLLVEVERGNRKRATRYRFKLPETAPEPDTSSINAEKPGVATIGTDRPKSSTRSRTPAKVKPSAERTPTTYELFERKKALQDLINGLDVGTGPSYGDSPKAKRLSKLKSDLARVNELLAGFADDPVLESKADPISQSLFDAMRRAVE